MKESKQTVSPIQKIGERLRGIFRLLLAAIRRTGSLIKSGSSHFWPVTKKAAGRIRHSVLLIWRVTRPVVSRTGRSIVRYCKDLLRLDLRKVLILAGIVSLLVLCVCILQLRNAYFGPNVGKEFLLFIHEKDDFEHVANVLKENGVLINPGNFRTFSKLKGYPNTIRPGAYQIQNGWSNNKLINVLRSGDQTPVMVTFNNVRTREDLAGKLSRQLQSDSLTLLSAFKNDSNATRIGFKPETFLSLFIPNTYFVYWTISPAAFLVRMKREYELFWNEARKQKAQRIGLTADQVATLASIVQEESNKNDEKPVIAGVYLNRLHKNWPLQADPTVRFALGDFTIKRILTAQLSIDSPYNTYKIQGLPPGPINLPEISSLEAVLNCAIHDYFYFCAKEDFSGYHNFAKTLAEHNRNAKKYQEALNKMKIFK